MSGGELWVRGVVEAQGQVSTRPGDHAHAWDGGSIYLETRPGSSNDSLKKMERMADATPSWMLGRLRTCLKA